MYMYMYMYMYSYAYMYTCICICICRLTAGPTYDVRHGGTDPPATSAPDWDGLRVLAEAEARHVRTGSSRPIVF